FWVYNVREVPTAFMCIIRSENPATEGMDYWSVKVPLNFEGWKRFGLLIRDGGGARTPRGWDQVDSISFRASGWNNEPSPDATVYIDRLELRGDIGGEGPLIDDEEFFSLLRDDIEALAPVREAAADGDCERADELLLEYMRNRQQPKFAFDCSEWDKSRDPDFNTARADAVMEHIFSWQGREADLPDDIDWTYNPFDKDDPAYTPEWTYDLNRFGFWRDLGRAYWATGDEKYAREFVDQLTDWVHDQPAPVLGSPNSAPTWRTIEQGIRTAGSWQDAYCYFLHSPSLTPEAHTLFLKSFVEHGRTLTRMAVEHPEHRGNWVTMEMNGLAHIGVMFPEFTEAKGWRDVAYGRLMAELDRQVYPDGAQKELTTGYHQVSLGNFKRALEPAERNDVEVPDGYLSALKRMYEYNLEAMIPGGRLPPLNDAGMTNVTGSLQEAYEIWGDEKFAWGAGGGGEPSPLGFTSRFFPWAGQAVMRSGWDREARYMMFEIGPFGIGHQHEDKLGLYLYGYGKPLLTEAGTYRYDRSKWRRYVLSTAAHNTIMVDGVGQHRRGLSETYQREEPMTGSWESNDVFDWASGRYTDGYGPVMDEDGNRLGRDHDITDVEHERTVLYLKPRTQGEQDYFVVFDRLIGESDTEHTYSNLFHLDAEEASVDEETMVVSSADAGRPGLTLIPLDTAGLSLRMVKGQEDPVQGWIPREGHREVPTAIYEKTGPTPQRFVTILMPRPDEEVTAVNAEILQQDASMIALEVTTDVGTDTLLYSFEAPQEMQAGDISTDARLAVVRRPDRGDPHVGILNGSKISVADDLIPVSDKE
ncbi:MAG: alginate lyase family protein, partial [Armatimonadota bacterium]